MIIINHRGSSNNMKTIHYTAFLATILVLQYYSHVATATFDIPAFSPIFGGGVCEESVCGRGECVPLDNTTIGFACECEPGWRQALPQYDEYPRFLPCVIPNCTLNYTCSNDPFDRRHPPPPPPPPPPPSRGANLTFIDPCIWTDCGGGRCSRSNSPFTRTCECHEGYYNLLNATIFPCYRQCTFGEDCAALKFNTSTSILEPNPLFHDNYNHAASLIERAGFAVSITTMTMLARVILKYI